MRIFLHNPVDCFFQKCQLVMPVKQYQSKTLSKKATNLKTWQFYVCVRLIGLVKQVITQSQRHRQLQRKVASDYFYSQGND